MFRQVVLGYASAPEAAFRRILISVRRARKGSTIRRFRGYHNLFLEAAVHYPADPEGSLLRILDAVHRLESDARFAEFRNSPSVYFQAVVNYPADRRVLSFAGFRVYQRIKSYRSS